METIMMRPSPEVVALVDKLVTWLDAEPIEGPSGAPATSSYALIVSAWERFKLRVDALDAAVAEPIVEGAANVLLSAAALTDHETFKLAFWLTHVGEAISAR
jgi:hypothetical protein